MSKNLIYIVSISDPNAKVDHSLYSKYCIHSWEYWCKENNVDLHVVTQNDPRCGRPIWNKELVYNIGKDYDKIGVVDADTMVRWDTPNIFDKISDKFYMVKDDSNWSWVYKSINNYQKFFPDTSLDIDEYGNAGVLFFDSKFLHVCEEIFNFYLDNKQELDSWNKGGGREQTIFNFTLKKNKVTPTFLSPKWNLISMHKRELFRNNFQLDDAVPHFVKYGYIWHFTGFSIEDREKLVKQTWDLVKHNYGH